MNLRRMQSCVLALLAGLSLGSLVHVALGAEKSSAPAGNEDFFVISSVDVKKDQLVLKRPTEVTELVRVNDKTVMRDEEGKTIELKNLRAGDTVYVAFATGAEASRVAARIRKAPMTVEELHRRYVPFQ